MESSDYKQVLILPPNPNTRRGYRVSWAAALTKGSYLAYACQSNVILRSLSDPRKSAVVYTDYPMSKVTSVQFTPNGEFIASGDDKGKVKIFSYDEASKTFVVKKEHGMLAGPIHTLVYTEDGQRMAAGGEGKDMLAKAILADSGTKIGDIFGPSKTVLSMDIKPKPYRLVVSGENNEVYVFDGAPFKHTKTITQHTSFVNKVAYRPDGKSFVTVSSDKSIVLHDTESMEVIRKIEKAHNKGIMDVNWIDEQTIVTCSTDNEIKFWNIENGAEIRSVNPNEDGKERIENQQLGLIATKEQTFTVSLNSNINVWNQSDIESGQKTPSYIIQGHANYIQSLTYAGDVLISSDQDGKVISWTKDDVPQAQIFSGEGHANSVTLLTSFGPTVFSASGDGTIKKSNRISSESTVYEFANTMKITGAPIAFSAANGKYLFVLSNQNKLYSIDIESFTVGKEIDLKDYEGTALAATIDEIWVGDKKGIIHILSQEDLSQKGTIEKKHNHAISIMTTSADGNQVASGDAYRYIYVFNAETKEETGCFAYHTSKIIGLNFNRAGTLLLTSGLDLTVGIANLADKTKKTIHRPNEKELTAAIFDDGERFFTAGYDCSIRIWSK